MATASMASKAMTINSGSLNLSFKAIPRQVGLGLGWSSARPGSSVREEDRRCGWHQRRL